MSRHKARILAFQALYSYDAYPVPVENLLTFDWEGEKALRMDENAASFARNLIAGTIENLAVIDEKIKSHLVRWEISRLKRVDLAILRTGVYSLLFQKDTPPGIIIEEAIAIAREFGADGSFRFINGLLDTIRKESS